MLQVCARAVSKLMLCSNSSSSRSASSSPPAAGPAWPLVDLLPPVPSVVVDDLWFLRPAWAAFCCRA